MILLFSGRLLIVLGGRESLRVAPEGIDAAREGADPDQLISAARDARERAMLTPDDLAELRRHRPFEGAGL